MRKIFFALIITLYQVSYSQIFEVDTVLWSGTKDSRINLVILGDGYRVDELSQFVGDAKNFSDALFLESPYKEYKNYFNVFAIKVPSNESGASHPGTAIDVNEPKHPVLMVDNYFGSSFDTYNLHRILYPTNISAVYDVLANNFPVYDQVVMLVNTPYYGGSGGDFAVASLAPDSAEIAIHEMGHSFAFLNDEYYYGDELAFEGINMTQETDPDLVKWKNWMNLNGIGIYQHCCGGNSASWYRPHQNCKMRVLGVPFCSVCTEGIIERIHDMTSPLISFTPQNNGIIDFLSPTKFKVNIIETIPETMHFEWVLNGEVMNNDRDSILISTDNLIIGNNELLVTVKDTTSFLKIDNHESIHFENVLWNINYSWDFLDDDNDGVLNNVDTCPNTPIGASVDNNGCILLPANNFNFLAIDETCPSQTDGQIIISAQTSYNYRATVAGTDYYFTTNLTIDNLSPGNYEVCIAVPGQTSNNCTTLTIEEGISVAGEASTSNYVTSVEIMEGTAPFEVIVNGDLRFTTQSNTFDVDVKHGDLIEVKTAINCEGVFSKTIQLYDVITMYPNPTVGLFELAIPLNIDALEIELYNYNSQLISRKSYQVIYGKVQLDLSNRADGIYLVKVLTNNPVTLKILKK